MLAVKQFSLLCLSDMHLNFNLFAPEALPNADIAIIAGDFTNCGTRYGTAEVDAARTWVAAMARKYHKVFYVCGNHDIGMNNDTLGYAGYKTDAPGTPDPGKVVGIEDTTISRFGYTFLGSGLSPCFDAPNLATTFCRMTPHRAFDLSHWENAAPADIVVSHCPPYGILDSAGKLYDRIKGCFKEMHLGSPGLQRYIREHRPRLVICGHIHEAAGYGFIHAVGDVSEDVPNMLVPDHAIHGYDTEGPDATDRIWGKTLVVNCAQRPVLVTFDGDNTTAWLCASNV